MKVTTLDKAKVSLVTQHPFFASILMKRQLIEDETIPTAAVDQRNQIYINPTWFNTLSVEEVVFVLAHEIGHVIGQHATRRGARTPKKWNIAGDAWINDMLKAADIGTPIKGCVQMDGSKDETVDEIYNKLPDDPTGDGPGGTGNDIIERGSPLTPEEATRIDAETRVEIAQAAQAAKAQGKMPTALAKIIADLIDPGTPWHEILERYMTSYVRGDYSWSRPNRRFADIAYLPSTGKVAEMGEIVLQVDVSGSINQRELAYYNGHIARIIEQCNPERVHVLYVDTGVCKHEIFEQGEEVKLEFYSGGGTDMEAGFEFIAKEGIDPEVFVCLTDGYTDFNVDKAPNYPVLWCISSDINAPYGENIHFSLE
jgi:predicted metal-dependent peptidase